jgi:hypothetical protein
VRIGFEKRKRIAEIFGRVAVYTVSILILGGIISGKLNLPLAFTGLILFLLFFVISVAAEPGKEAY